jgi:hypothetical protein
MRRANRRALFLACTFAIAQACEAGGTSASIGAQDSAILSAVLAHSVPELLDYQVLPLALRSSVGLDGVEPDIEAIDSLNKNILLKIFPEVPVELWDDLAASTSSELSRPVEFQPRKNTSCFRWNGILIWHPTANGHFMTLEMNSVSLSLVHRGSFFVFKHPCSYARA